MTLVVKSRVREMLRGRHRVSDDFLERLDTEVAAMVRRAAERARANGRKTLKARDI